LKTPPKRKDLRISKSMMHVLWFAGLRGAVAYACVRKFPNLYGHADEFTAATMVIVLVTIIIMGGATEHVLRFLNIQMEIDEEEYMRIWREKRRLKGLFHDLGKCMACFSFFFKKKLCIIHLIPFFYRCSFYCYYYYFSEHQYIYSTAVRRTGSVLSDGNESTITLDRSGYDLDDSFSPCSASNDSPPRCYNPPPPCIMDEPKSKNEKENLSYN
jgi:hypothetical protein